MLRQKMLLIVFCVLTGCVSMPLSETLQREGVRSVTPILSLRIEQYPFEEWNRIVEGELKKAGAKAWEGHVAFDSRKRKEWSEFVEIEQQGDSIFRITGSRPFPELFDYLVIVRSGKEIRRYYVYGGDGKFAVQ